MPAHPPSTTSSAATGAEEREYLEAGLTPVGCRYCGNRVLVKKNSIKHTSIQWTSDAVDSCPEFAAKVAAGEVSALIDTCDQLRDSIEEAVRKGLLEVPTPGADHG